VAEGDVLASVGEREGGFRYQVCCCCKSSEMEPANHGDPLDRASGGVVEEIPSTSQVLLTTPLFLKWNFAEINLW